MNDDATMEARVPGPDVADDSGNHVEDGRGATVPSGPLILAFPGGGDYAHFHWSSFYFIGQCPDVAYRYESEALIGGDAGRITFEPRFIADAELQYYLRAADAVVLPFGDVLISGSAVLALSFGRPVVAPRLGCLVDLVPEQCGVLYDPDDEDGLRAAMFEVRRRSFDEAQIEAYVGSLRWDDAAATVLRVITTFRGTVFESGSR